jgi:anti-sigma regulatory factor (Ser/Thr protein kinase)
MTSSVTRVCETRSRPDLGRLEPPRNRPEMVRLFAAGIGQLDELSIARVFGTGPQLQLAPEPTSPRAARLFVRRHVDELDEDLRDSAELLASELVTNGVLHARSTMTLGVITGDASVLIAVRDNNGSAPSERLPSLSAESGRGISLVATIARQWGVAPEAGGKIIWCLIESEPHRVP